MLSFFSNLWTWSLSHCSARSTSLISSPSALTNPELPTEASFPVLLLLALHCLHSSFLVHWHGFMDTHTHLLYDQSIDSFSSVIVMGLTKRRWLFDFCVNVDASMRPITILHAKSSTSTTATIKTRQLTAKVRTFFRWSSLYMAIRAQKENNTRVIGDKRVCEIILFCWRVGGRSFALQLCAVEVRHYDSCVVNDTFLLHPPLSGFCGKVTTYGLRKSQKQRVNVKQTNN